MQINLLEKENYEGFIIEYQSTNGKVVLSSSHRGFEYEVYIGNVQQSLLNYDHRMKEVYVCSEKNLTLSVIKSFLRPNFKLTKKESDNKLDG